MFGSLFEKWVYRFTYDIKNYYFGVGHLNIFCYIICAFIYFIKDKTYIVINSVFLYLHLLLELGLYLLIVIFNC